MRERSIVFSKLNVQSGFSRQQREWRRKTQAQKDGENEIKRWRKKGSLVITTNPIPRGFRRRRRRRRRRMRRRRRGRGGGGCAIVQAVAAAPAAAATTARCTPAVAARGCVALTVEALLGRRGSR